MPLLRALVSVLNGCFNTVIFHPSFPCLLKAPAWLLPYSELAEASLMMSACFLE